MSLTSLYQVSNKSLTSLIKVSTKSLGRPSGGDSNLVDMSFKHRAVKVYNKVPVDVRTGTLATVKKKLRKWVLLNVPID